MPSCRLAITLACCLLAACGDGVRLRSADQRYAVLAQLAPAAAAMAPAADLWLVPFEDLHYAPADTKLLVIGAALEVAKAAVQAQQWQAASAFTPPLQAAAEVTLLVALGLDAPPQLALGVSYLTAANLASNGTPVFAPADFALQALRMERSATLHPTSPPPPVRFAVVRAAGDDPWSTTAKNAPRMLAVPTEPLHGEVAMANDAAAWRQELQRCLDLDYRTLLIATANPAPSAAARAAVIAMGARVVLFSPQPQDTDYSHWVGVDAATLGRAAAEALQQLRPEGARLVELLSEQDPRHQAFAAHLQLRDG